MKTFTSKTQKTGGVGESEAVKYLISKGFKIIERNYTRKWGEIDIVAKKGNGLHFIEVKSVTLKGVSYETPFRPEENMHSAKIQRLRRTLETYFIDREIDEDAEWQFDLVCIYLKGDRMERVEHIEDIVLA